MKLLNDCIKLGFKNTKALAEGKLLSDGAFPIEIVENCGERVEVRFVYGNNQKIFDQFLTTLSEYIINQYEKKILKQILSANYGDFKPFQLRDIISRLPELEQDEETGAAVRFRAVKEELRDYFKESDRASVEGLVTFRLQKYEALLHQTAEQLFDIYLTHKEYEEFIELLRYFVNVQNARPHLTHLIVNFNGMYTVLNEEKENITAECISDFANPEEITADNFDDLLISMLITLAPEKIVVHNSTYIRNAELFETINRVFGKVTYCTGCEMCENAFVPCKLQYHDK